MPTLTLMSHTYAHTLRIPASALPGPPFADALQTCRSAHIEDTLGPSTPRPSFR